MNVTGFFLVDGEVDLRSRNRCGDITQRVEQSQTCVWILSYQLWSAFMLLAFNPVAV